MIILLVKEESWIEIFIFIFRSKKHKTCLVGFFLNNKMLKRSNKKKTCDSSGGTIHTLKLFLYCSRMWLQWLRLLSEQFMLFFSSINLAPMFRSVVPIIITFLLYSFHVFFFSKENKKHYILQMFSLEKLVNGGFIASLSACNPIWF